MSLCIIDKETQTLKPITSRATCLDFFNDVLYACKNQCSVAKYGFDFYGQDYPHLLESDIYFVMEPDSHVPEVSEEYIEHINTVFRRINFRLFGKYRPAPKISLSKSSIPKEVTNVGFTRQYILRVPKNYLATYRLLNLVLKTARYMLMEPRFSEGWGLKYIKSHTFPETLTHEVFNSYVIDIMAVRQVLIELADLTTRKIVVEALTKDVKYNNITDVHNLAGIYTMANLNEYRGKIENEKNRSVRLAKAGAV